MTLGRAGEPLAGKSAARCGQAQCGPLTWGLAPAQGLKKSPWRLLRRDGLPAEDLLYVPERAGWPRAQGEAPRHAAVRRMRLATAPPGDRSDNAQFPR